MYLQVAWLQLRNITIRCLVTAVRLSDPSAACVQGVGSMSSDPASSSTESSHSSAEVAVNNGHTLSSAPQTLRPLLRALTDELRLFLHNWTVEATERDEYKVGME